MQVSGELHGLLAATAQRRPGKLAFLSQRQALTYAELDQSSGRLAASLRDLGLCRGDRVVIALDGVAEYLVAQFGTWRAGATVVPHNPDTRRDILRYALEHSQARAVILDRDHVPLLDGLSAALPDLEIVISVGKAQLSDPGRLRLADLGSLLAREDQLEHGGAGGDDLAYVVFTSGTTGSPKGVMLSHRNVLANTRSIVTYLELTSADVMGMILPFFYVYGSSIIHTHVAVGATIAMLGSLTFPAAVLNNLAAQRCTGFAGVPSTYARLAQLDLSSFDLSSLRYLTQAGGPMHRDLTRKMKSLVPGARLYVMYGQTEATARLSYLPPDELERKLGSVGIPIPGVYLSVMDDSGHELPRGQPGEVVARGENVMRGYWRDPEATARVLKSEGLRTGDLGYMDDDGFLFLIGRQSEIIKSGAHRVGPREIEEVIEQLPEVSECAVVGVPDELLGEAIVALVVRAPGAQIGPEAVLRHALAHLPRYKLPSTVRFVEDLPRTPTGKIRRRELLTWPNAAAG